MRLNRATYFRWSALAGIALALELSIALVAIEVAGRSATLIAGRSTAASPGLSPSPSPIAFAPPPGAPPPGGRSPAPPGTLARGYAAAAFYPPSGNLVLFGGVTSESQNFQLQDSGETWAWDGSRWTQLHPVNSPPARDAAGLVYDPVTKVLVLYGGEFATDTWTWDGTNWKQMGPRESPPKWLSSQMTYDATRKAVLLYVGSGNWPINAVNQTWSWDGSTWTQLPTSTDPNGSNLNTSAIVYDSARAQTILVGPSGTWVLGAAGWRRVTGGGSTSTTDNSQLNDFALADDEARGLVVEMGANGDTWTWDGKAWTAQNPSVAPPPRSGEVLAYDPLHHDVVLFGGQTGRGASWSPLGDTWLWDGTAWKQVA